MHRVAFLTMAETVGYVLDDHVAADRLRARGIEVEWVVWNRPGIDWHVFDAVVLRSTFDYIDAVPRFLEVLGQVQASSARLFNDLHRVRWNVDKRYLVDLERHGAAVVPSQVCWHLGPERIEILQRRWQTAELVVKPLVGASGVGVRRLQGAVESAVTGLDGEVLVQPFLPGIVDDGELSLCFFDGRFSHGVRKVPKAGSFLVQEEHGGTVAPAQPPSAALAVAEGALNACGRCLPMASGPPLYARVDVVCDPAGRFRVMELELIEPQLFLSSDAAAADRFAQAIIERLEPADGSGRTSTG